MDQILTTVTQNMQTNVDSPIIVENRSVETNIFASPVVRTISCHGTQDFLANCFDKSTDEGSIVDIVWNLKNKDVRSVLNFKFFLVIIKFILKDLSNFLKTRLPVIWENYKKTKKLENAERIHISKCIIKHILDSKQDKMYVFQTIIFANKLLFLFI